MYRHKLTVPEFSEIFAGSFFQIHKPWDISQCILLFFKGLLLARAGGIQGITFGQGTVGVNGANERLALTSNVLDDLSSIVVFSAFTLHFTEKGVIVLHGCNVGGGEAGSRLLLFRVVA